MSCIVPDDSLENLLCSKCEKYLSVLPVTIYGNDETRCGRCDVQKNENESENVNGETDGMMDETENKEENGRKVVEVYNKLAEKMLFKCVNRYEGCDKLLLPSQVKEHEEQCRSKQYKCPICNETPLQSYQMIHHFKQPDHPIQISPEFNINQEGSGKIFGYYNGKDIFFIKYQIDGNEVKFEADCMNHKDVMMYTFQLSKSKTETSYCWTNLGLHLQDGNRHRQVESILKLQNNITQMQCSFIVQLKSDLNCTNCGFLIHQDKIYECCCTEKHFICHPCSLVRPICPGKYRCELMEPNSIKVLQENKLFCKWKCNQSFVRRELCDHEMNCKYRRSIICPVCEKEDIANVKHFKNHISTHNNIIFVDHNYYNLEYKMIENSKTDENRFYFYINELDETISYEVKYKKDKIEFKIKTDANVTIEHKKEVMQNNKNKQQIIENNFKFYKNEKCVFMVFNKF